jgi:hypothetical protein
MDEIERIFPNATPVAGDVPPTRPTAQRARATISGQCGALRKRAASLQSELAKVSASLPVLEELHDYLRLRYSDKWPLHVMDWFVRNDMFVQTSSGALSEALPVILDEARHQAEELGKRYPYWMDTTARKMGLKPDKGSKHPVYRFVNGFFTVTVSEPGLTARIEDFGGILFERMPADPGAVITCVEEQRIRIFERPFDPQEFLQKLLRNYQAIVERDAMLKDGEAVPIKRLTGRLRDNEKSFHNDEFIVDLTRLLDSRVSEVNGRKLLLEQTKDDKQGLYVFPKYGSGYVGFLRFSIGGINE